jgi:hypothetical protein
LHDFLTEGAVVLVNEYSGSLRVNTPLSKHLSAGVMFFKDSLLITVLTAPANASITQNAIEFIDFILTVLA